jgi:hypothetical protein
MVLGTRNFYDVASGKRTGRITSPQRPPPISHIYDQLIKFYG